MTPQIVDVILITRSIFADTFRCDETLRKISEFRLSPEKSAEENAVDRRFQYIKGSVHQNTLDLPFIFQVSSNSSVTLSDILFLKQDRSIFRHSSNPLCVFSKIERVRLCVV